ncbi:ubiquinone biosynthesis accessory factor UbiJ [Chitinasiproducens palmae]|uniref:Ubiquinone biosynthesis accessory factor UbiJ n=1 Tax=Chitinasiproducens palmae TaxID=1770053 RepID=A0A1H2PPE3_9BURK|nr:SCP2 sterol-binding domain-containing protein [Chitinasiproducens palmae]SDV48171.1 ubiquinone biosynthesis protein UbiJ [Chitinasiproducens palmae]
MSLAAQSFSAAVNHLLAREAWASAELARFAGKRARLVAAPVELRVAVEADGRLRPVEHEDEAPADVTISVGGDAYPAFLQGGRPAAMRHVRIEGDAEFAATIGKLAERLRWEPEADLANLVGDGPAHRLGSLGRTALEHALRVGRGFAGAAADYLLDENPHLVRVQALQAVQDELADARDEVARLEKRIEKLERHFAAAGARPSGRHPTSSVSAAPLARIDQPEAVPQLPADASKPSEL